MGGRFCDGHAAGNELVPGVVPGNTLWRRACALAHLAFKYSIPFVIEHPRNSKAWQMTETSAVLELAGVQLHSVDWCQYSDEPLPSKKPTRLCSNMPWLPAILRHCPAGHLHGEPLRGDRAKAAAAYHPLFCTALAQAFMAWHAPTGSRPSETAES